MSKDKIKTIVFDICDVVWNLTPSRNEFYTEVSQIFHQDLSSVMEDFLKVYQQLQLDQMTLRDWFEQKGVNYSQKQINNLIEAIYQDDKFMGYFNQEVIDLISELRRFCQVGCLSNIENFLGKYFEKHFNPLFDYTIFSYNIGHRKPEIEAYQEIFKKINCSPEEVVFIDDKERNLIPARQTGFNCLLYTNSTQLKTDLEEFLL